MNSRRQIYICLLVRMVQGWWWSIYLSVELLVCLLSTWVNATKQLSHVVSLICTPASSVWAFPSTHLLCADFSIFSWCGVQCFCYMSWRTHLPLPELSCILKGAFRALYLWEINETTCANLNVHHRLCSHKSCILIIVNTSTPLPSLLSGRILKH